MLVFTSLSKLQPFNSGSHTGDSCVEAWKQRRMWEQIHKVKNACSLGSGPGNDLVGLVAFLRKQHQHCCKHRLLQGGNLLNQSTAAMTLQDNKLLKT
jgi:hypothetical protein